MSPLPGRTPPFHVEVALQLPEAIARAVAIKLESFRVNKLLEGGLNRTYGDQCLLVGLVEFPDAEVDGVLGGCLNGASLNASRHQIADNAGVWLAFGIVASRNDETQRIERIGLFADLYGCGCGHELIGLGVNEICFV